MDRTGSERITGLTPRSGRSRGAGEGRIFAFALARSTTGAFRAWSRRFRIASYRVLV
jgi:hypothetical protein